MNDRKRKFEQCRRKKEQEKRRELHKLLDLVLDINGLEPRNRKHTGDLPTAFFYFSGHIADATVNIHNHGWCEDSPYCHTDWFWSGRNFKSGINDLEKTVNELSKRDSHGPA